MNDAARKKLGQRIREKRMEMGFSQTDLAEKVGKSSPAYISLIESGERNISTMDLMLLAKHLGTTVSQLVEETADNRQTFMQALRANKALSADDKKQIVNFYEYLKSKDKKKHG